MNDAQQKEVKTASGIFSAPSRIVTLPPWSGSSLQILRALIRSLQVQPAKRFQISLRTVNAPECLR